MVSRNSINQFLSQSKIAVVGVSRSGKKFGNSVFKDLKTKGYQVYPINSNTDIVEGEQCYNNLTSLPEKIDGVILVVPPRVTETVVKEASLLGIKNIWMQQGSESNEAIRFCEENGINTVYGECIMMFTEPAAFIHRFHRGINKFLGKLPK